MAAVDPVFEQAQQPELMVSAVLHLMSHYTANGDDDHGGRLATVIERHLKALAERADLGPVLRATCQQLSLQWAEVVAQAGVPRREAAGAWRRWFSLG